MTHLTTQKEVKTFVSALRRELKAHNLDLSHNKLLDSIAIALGYRGAEELHKKLPEKAVTAPPAQDLRAALEAASKYPLKNKGQFDFCAKGALFDGPTLSAITATLEDIFECSAWVNSGTRLGSGDLEPEHDGSTEVNWDFQKTRKGSDGMNLFMLEGETTYASASHLFVVPEKLEARIDELFADRAQTVLPVMTSLVQEYVEFYTTSAKLRPAVDDFEAVLAVCKDAAQLLGFQMTAVEVAAFCEQMKAK